MSILDSGERTIVYKVGIDQVRYLIAKDLQIASAGVEVECVLKSVEGMDDLPGCPPQEFSHFKVTVK